MRRIFVAVPAIFVLFASSMSVHTASRVEHAAVSPAPPSDVRVIELEHVGTGYAASIKPTTTVRIHQWGNSKFNDVLHMSVQGIHQLRAQSPAQNRPSSVYALYLTDAPSVAAYNPFLHFKGRFFFNVKQRFAVPGGSFESWLGLLPTGLSAETKTITCFIVEELDDGLRFDPIRDLSRVVFAGSSTLP